MSGTSEGGKKAAAHQNMSEKGRQGAEALNSDPEKKSAAAQKAAETRKRENPDAFSEMGKEGGKVGGSHSHSGSKSKQEGNE